MAKIVVTETEGSSKQTTSKIDLGIGDLPNNVKSDIIEEVGNYLVEQTLENLSDAKSPVSGESFPALSKNYKKIKVAEGGRSIPDLELHGDLKDALTFRATDNGLEIGFFGDQADKADGHLKFSGRENNTPKRRFLPAEGQSFKRDIVQGVNQIIEDKTSETFTKSDFSSVESSADLYDVLGEVLSGASRSEIRSVVAGNPALLDILIELDLLRYL